MSGEQIKPKSPSGEMPQRLPRDYLKFRWKIGVIKNFIGWTTTSGVIFGIIPGVNLLLITLQGDRDLAHILLSMLLFVGFYVIPMLTCIGLYRWWLGRYHRSYEWNLIGDTFCLREGVFIRTDTRIPLAIIKGAGISQGPWEWKNGWFKVTIATGGRTRDTNDSRPRIAARILGVREPRIVQELIVNAARVCNKHA